MRLPEVVRGAFQSVFQRDRVHRVTRGEQNKDKSVHFNLVNGIRDGSITQFSKLEYATRARPLDKEGIGTTAILVGIELDDPYSQVYLFLLGKDEAQRMVREIWVTSCNVLGKPTHEELELLEKELGREISGKEAFEGRIPNRAI